MKKFGFTLVEVLMTLGIIGVIGMLVTPSLMQNGRNETNAARLSTAVSNFENALAAGMASDRAEDLYDWEDTWCNTPADGGDCQDLAADVFYAQLTRFMVLNGHEEPGAIGNLSAGLADMGTDGSKGGASDLAGTNVYTALRTKNGALIYIADKANQADGAEDDEATARAAGRTLYNKAANIIIDVNGEAGPNIVGRDVFAFALSHDGTLFPYGSHETASYVEGGRVKLTAREDACDVNAQDNNGEITGISDPLTCTARVVENGYRIDY